MRAAGWIGALSLLLLAACTRPEDVKHISQPKTPPVRNLTNFSESLRCMDDLFVAYGTQPTLISTSGIPDSTGEVGGGAKDMLISTVSRMTQRSNAFIYLDAEQGTQLVGNEMALMHAAMLNKPGGTKLAAPRYYIRGAVTQLDSNVTSDEASLAGSASFGGFSLGGDRIASVLSLDLNIVSFATRQVQPGLNSSNSLTVLREGRAGSGRGLIDKAGLRLELAFDRSEGVHQALRTLIELGTIELLGKLAAVPYWRCLQIEQTDPEMIADARSRFAGMAPEERVELVQRRLRALGFYQGAVSGVADTATREAVGAYQAASGLLGSGRIDADLYVALIGDTLARGEPPRPEPEVLETAAVTMPGPLALRLERGGGGTGGWRRGEVFAVLATLSDQAFTHCFYQSGDGTITRILPNATRPDPLLPGGQPIAVPGPEDAFEIRLEQRGVSETILCIAARQELDGRLPPGLRPKDLSPLPVASLDELIALYQDATGGEIVHASQVARVQG